jgi:hypothetical protein
VPYTYTGRSNTTEAQVSISKKGRQEGEDEGDEEKEEEKDGRREAS